MRLLSLRGRRPQTLGPQRGRLAPCGGKPNCVCSQVETELPRDGNPHHVQPFSFGGSPQDAWAHLIEVIQAQHNATIRSRQRDYLHAEFESRWLGFVDDVEFLLDAEHALIHVRSASRLGYSDFGVNRARVEALREAFDDLQALSES